MKNKVLIFLTLLLSVTFVLSGCSIFPTEEGSSLVDAYVYYIEENGTTLVEMNVSLPNGSKEKKADYLIEKLLNPPAGKKSPICDGAKLLSLKIEDEIATVNFSEDFSDFKDARYTLSPVALAKTLCSLDFISGVNILVEGEPALGIDGTPIGVIMKSDVMDSAAPTDIKKASIVLYFANETGEGLTKERRDVEFPSSNTLEKTVVEELIKGPKNAGNIAMIPSDVKVISVETKNSVCFVNLSKEFIEKYQGGSAGEILTIYSIVNSLTELDTVGSVQFLIDGEKKETFDHMAINEPIARNKSIIVE